MITRPILFSDAMVRAILDGQKTQTRRIVKQQLTPLSDESGMYSFDHKGLNYRTSSRTTTVGAFSHLLQFCPYGQPGDQLWVREAFAQCDMGHGRAYAYRATGDQIGCMKWKPSIHMPRDASRITLEIIRVRVERLQDINERDAWAEGAFSADLSTGREWLDPSTQQGSCRLHYRDIWESINGPSSWNQNPWVWVIEFAVVTG